MTKHSFVVLLDYIEDFTESVINVLGLNIIADESDIDLGYFTVEGTPSAVKELKSYLNGTSYI